jgi:hypothetical protein
VTQYDQGLLSDPSTEGEGEGDDWVDTRIPITLVSGFLGESSMAWHIRPGVGQSLELSPIPCEFWGVAGSALDGHWSLLLSLTCRFCVLVCSGSGKTTLLKHMLENKQGTSHTYII